jgi:hypothetical protein
MSMEFIHPEAFEDSGYVAKLTKENLLLYFPFLENNK